MPTRLEDLTARAECDGVQQLVVGAIVEHDGRILLLRRPGNDFMGGIWELPSGKVDEVEEETGLRVTGVNRYIPCMRGAPRWRDNASSLRAHPSRAGGTSRRRRQSRNPGLVPACAGSTAACRNGESSSRAHPCVRGEHHAGSHLTAAAGGSSPRARGALEAGAGTPASRGLIPACAGSTSTMCLACAICGAHPRVRGEHADLTRTFPVTPGSSPRARGAPGHGGRAASRTGLIPACAGSTPTRSLTPTAARAHPRVRGEHRRVFVNSVCDLGSSPRARGAHFLTCEFSAPNPVFHSLSTAAPR
ncbi:Domain of uncharacterised function (DUF2825) [Nocardia farcinica]|nr:Domain of uncharacterised function (DUF2825) [Nocardia farcinica]